MSLSIEDTQIGQCPARREKEEGEEEEETIPDVVQHLYYSKTSIIVESFYNKYVFYSSVNKHPK